VAQVLATSEKAALGLNHPRSGDLVALAKENAWFTYYYWLDDAVAPDLRAVWISIANPATTRWNFSWTRR